MTNPIAKRLFDITFASLGLLVLSPVLLLIAALVKCFDGSPVFFRQERVGQWGRLFKIWKFRTMIVNAETKGLGVTRNGDDRITRLGRWLRKKKLDELPQLWNVLCGDMSFVGPRPEVPRYVAGYTPAQREILRVKPGITDLATLTFRDEENLLAAADDVESFYRERCLPQKIALTEQYLAKANLWEDVLIILRTVFPARMKPVQGDVPATLHWTNRVRMPVVVVVYGVGLMASLWLAYQLRFDFAVPEPDYQQLWNTALWIIPFQLVLLVCIGHCGGLLSYFSIPDLSRLLLTLTVASLVIAVVWIVTNGQFAPPRSVVVADLLVSFVALAAVRLVFRRSREIYLDRTRNRNGNGHRRVTRVGIMGAGDTGAALAEELLAKTSLDLRPVLFLDDDATKWHSELYGIPVVGAPEILLEQPERWNLQKVIIATPSVSGKRMQELVLILQAAHLPFETVPSLAQLANGQVKVSQIRAVEIEDLLGREPVRLETDRIRNFLTGRTVMVTGAGGSIGSELCRQIASYGPERLLIVEQSEANTFQIEQELIRRGHGELIVPLIANIRDEARMREIFDEFWPQLVFHAAAYKHVPLMESHPHEAIKNNTLGTARLANLAQEFGVHRFVLISSDKAINPTSVMGATKRLAEIYLQSLSGNRWPSPFERLSEPVATPSSGNDGECTEFMAVRFGNVLGSSGSVVPIFKEQIAAGGPVTVTHPDMTRYFMTIPEAVSLVLQSATQGRGGEISVLDMGRPVKIVDLARQLIVLSGFRPDEDIEIKFVGIRPGEKLAEELAHNAENLLPTKHPKIMQLVTRAVPYALAQEQIEELEDSLPRFDATELKLLLQSFVGEYRPHLTSRSNQVVA